MIKLKTIMKIWGWLVIFAFVFLMFYEGELDIYGVASIGLFTIPMFYFLLNGKEEK